MFSIFEIALQNANLEIIYVVIIWIEMQWQLKKDFLSDGVCVIIKSASENAQKHYILEKLAVISDTDFIITHTPSDKKPFFRCHCISFQRQINR